MNIHRVEADLFHVGWGGGGGGAEGRTDGQTDNRDELVVAFLNFANAPKNLVPISCITGYLHY